MKKQLEIIRLPMIKTILRKWIIGINQGYIQR